MLAQVEVRERDVLRTMNQTLRLLRRAPAAIQGHICNQYTTEAVSTHTTNALYVLLRDVDWHARASGVLLRGRHNSSNSYCG